MPFFIYTVIKLFGAILAGKGLFICMDSFMSLALAWFWKSFIAKSAFISITISTTSLFMAFLHRLQQMIKDGMLFFMIFIVIDSGDYRMHIYLNEENYFVHLC